MIDKRPAVIAKCATAADVIAALQLARGGRYDVAVRAGGHSVAGMCLNDGGIVIDVRPMKDIEVDPDARQVRVGAGVTWGEFDGATQEHGLATTAAGVDHRRRRAHARRRFRLARAEVRARLRQPRLGRSRHG